MSNEGRVEPRAGWPDAFEGKILEDGIKIEKLQRRFLGSGYYRAIDPGLEPFLVKRFSVEFLPEETSWAEGTDGCGFIEKLFAQERAFLNKHSDLPFVPRLIRSGVFEDEPYIIMEWASGVTVKDILLRDDSPKRVEDSPDGSAENAKDDEIKEGVERVSEKKNRGLVKPDLKWVIDFALEFSSAVRVLHRRRVCHRGLLPDNLFLDERNGSLVFIDLGTAENYAAKTDDMDSMSDLRCLELRASYIPHDLRSRPEILLDEKVARGLDVFATGRITLELLLKVLEGERFVGSSTMDVCRLKEAMAGYAEPLRKAVSELLEPFTDGYESEIDENRGTERLTAAGLCHAMERVRRLPEFAVEGSAGPSLASVGADTEKSLAAASVATSKFQAAVRPVKRRQGINLRIPVFAGVLILSVVAGVLFFMRRPHNTGREEIEVERVPGLPKTVSPGGDADEARTDTDDTTKHPPTRDVQPDPVRDSPGGEKPGSAPIPSFQPVVEEQIRKTGGGPGRKVEKTPVIKKMRGKKTVDIEDEFLRVVDDALEKDDGDDGSK